MTFISVCGLKKKKDWHSCFFSSSSCPSCYPSNYPEAVPSSCWPLTLSSPKPFPLFPLILPSTSILCLFLFSRFVSAKQHFHILSFLVMRHLVLLFSLHNSAFAIFSSPLWFLALRKSTRRGRTACQMVRWPRAAPALGSWMKGSPGRALSFHRDLHHNLLSRPASSWLRRPALYSLHYKPYLSLQRPWSSLTQWVTKAVTSQMLLSPYRWQEILNMLNLL